MDIERAKAMGSITPGNSTMPRTGTIGIASSGIGRTLGAGSSGTLRSRPAEVPPVCEASSLKLSSCIVVYADRVNDFSLMPVLSGFTAPCAAQG
jgi:hypothetical protein